VIQPIGRFNKILLLYSWLYQQLAHSIASLS
jgi:hypothetical protein